MSEEKEFAFNIKEHIGVINTYSTGWTKELNLVEWNGNNAKFDIRDWEPSHEHMSRGITLRKDEAETLAGLLFEFLRKDEEKSVNRPAGRRERKRDCEPEDAPDRGGSFGQGESGRKADAGKRETNAVPFEKTNKAAEKASEAF